MSIIPALEIVLDLASQQPMNAKQKLAYEEIVRSVAEQKKREQRRNGEFLESDFFL